MAQVARERLRRKKKMVDQCVCVRFFTPLFPSLCRSNLLFSRNSMLSTAVQDRLQNVNNRLFARNVQTSSLDNFHCCACPSHLSPFASPPSTTTPSLSTLQKEKHNLFSIESSFQKRNSYYIYICSGSPF
ncbi:hypothetical protein T4A_3393 [Trichinella pseudospiralis]|uniref:Uncharacterized protein n=2 Tax=Trichinella pseudospiralis TaxID=6337 RepID=A0A0V1EWV4_TRIPS|nr:hypothetical protein T4A_3393 [Trichinella pseudospiralis]